MICLKRLPEVMATSATEFIPGNKTEPFRTIQKAASIVDAGNILYPLFKEALTSAQFDRSLFRQESWRTRKEIPLDVYRQLWDAAREALGKRDVGEW